MARRFQSSTTQLLVMALFTVSGAVGLLYEVSWVRSLTLVFGNTTHASSATLALFFLGLALGAALAGRLGPRIRRPLRVYGLLEIGLGAYAAATPFLFDAILPLYRAVYLDAPAARPLLLAAQVGLCALVLLPPTCAMGATLPVLSAGLARHSHELSARIGRLYGWNTAGAAFGTFVTGFALLGAFGVSHTIWIGATTSIAIGILALFVSRAEALLEPVGATSPELTQEMAAEEEAPAHAGLLLAVMALSGAVGLGYEITWTRLSVYALSTTAYAFAVMLITYLTGLALGDLWASRFLRRRRATFAHLAWTQVGIGIATAISLWGLLQLGAINRSFNSSPLLNTALGFYAFRFGQCVLVMLLPTVLLGATFPLAVDLLSPQRGRAARAVGRLYAWNTIGGVVGSIVAGFALIPIIGTVNMLRLGIAINAVLAATLLWPRTARGRKAVWGAAAVTLGIAGIALRGVSLVPILISAEFGSIILYQDEGITGTVTIHEYPETGVKVLSINGCNVAGTTLPLLTTQKIQGHVPALLHGHPHSAMQIGFGSGETARVLKLHGVETIHGVELSPEVIKAGDHLAELNGQVAYSKQFHPIIMDAVNYVRLTDRTYDLILNDSIFPGLAGSSALYTRDHFAACAARLNPGGIFSCWLPLDVTPDTFRMILASLADVFPHVQVWVATNCNNKNALLVGSFSVLTLDLPAWEQRLARPGIGRDLEAAGLGGAEDIAGYVLLDTDGVRAVSAGAQLNTHDHPRLEYAPFSAEGYDSRWADNLTAMLAYKPDLTGLLSAASRARPELTTAVEEARSANAVFTAGLLQELRGQGPNARMLYEQVLTRWPGHNGAQYTLAKMDDLVARARRMTPADTTDPAALRRLADAYWRGGKVDGAIPVFQRLLEIAGPDPEMEERLVVCALAAHQPQAAEPLIAQVAARHPDDATWSYNAALVHQLAGRTEEAVAAYEALLAREPDYHPARVELAKLYMQQGEYVQSEQVLRADPAAGIDAQWFHLLALAFVGQGRTIDARAAVREALKRNPDFLQARDLAEWLDTQGS